MSQKKVEKLLIELMIMVSSCLYLTNIQRKFIYSSVLPIVLIYLINNDFCKLYKSLSREYRPSTQWFILIIHPLFYEFNNLYKNPNKRPRFHCC